jgi:hypothetical protein
MLCLLASHCLWQNMKLLPVRLAASRENLSKIYYIHIFINLQWLEVKITKYTGYFLRERRIHQLNLYLKIVIDLHLLFLRQIVSVTI